MTGAFQHGLIAPPIDADSRWWWEAIAQERLLLPRCGGCGRCFFPPQPTCPHCGSADWDRVTASGRGRVYSWVVVHVPLHPAFAEDVPYTLVAAELDEGVRVFGRLAPGDPAEPDAPLEACFYTVADTTLLGFRRRR